MMIVIILMRLWLILSLSAAAPLNPLVDKETMKDQLMTEDIMNADDMDGDGLHTHISGNTARDPRLITFYAGDVILSGSIAIDGDHAHIASIITNDVSEGQPSAQQGTDGGWSDWSGYSPCSATCGSATKTRERTCTEPAPAGGAQCQGSNKETVGCDSLPDCVCPADVAVTQDCMCAGISCATGSTCVGGSTCISGCPADKTIMSECMCGFNSCALGSVCVSGSTCTPVCSVDTVNTDACFCKNGQGGGQDCNAEQGCTSDGVCLDGCPADETITSKCMCDANSCAQESVCISGSTCTPALHHVLRILGATVHTMNESNLVSVDHLNESSDETAIRNSITTTKQYIDGCFINMDVNCTSKELWPLTQKLEETFIKIQNKDVSSSFLAIFNEDIKILLNRVEKVRDKQTPPEKFTACGSECSCGSKTCKEDQMCRDYKCLSVCDHSLRYLLTDDCFCTNDDGKGHLCSKDSACNIHGCLPDPKGFFFWIG